MKCKNCGADYKTRELKCPYCGTENLIGQIWLIERAEAEDVYHTARKKNRGTFSLYVFSKILNRILIAGVGIFLFILLFAKALVWGHGVYLDIYKKTHSREISRTLETYHRDGSFQQLRDYLDKYDLYDSDYYVYDQAALIHFDYEMYKQYALEFLDYSEEEKTKYDYMLEFAIDWSRDVYNPQRGFFRELAPENQEMYERYKTDVMAFWVGSLALDEKQIDLLTSDVSALPGEEMDALVSDIMTRRPWQ